MRPMRYSGVIMHISSLANKYGIGKLGKEAFDFVDWLKKAGQHYWQILPLSPTSCGDSPYQSFSVYAGNPYFIDFLRLEEQGLLLKDEYENVPWSTENGYVDYSLIYANIWSVLRKAFSRFKANADYKKFCEENSSWLYDYALFMALKSENDGKAWYDWDWDLVMCRSFAVKEAKERLDEDIRFHCFLQYEFFTQWGKLKKYANDNGIEIIGDIPIYCALDSVDVWQHPELFDLDEDKKPVNVAGCPPDGFAPKGQLWGNPVYDWDVMKKQDYKWWINRIAFAEKIYDVVRIDHFRGFDTFYAIPAENETAEHGEWKKGCGIDMFRQVKKVLGNVRIIAEDLGFITDSVRKLLKDCGFPGMKMLQFGFDPNCQSEYLPCNFNTSNCVAYTGTHDSDTILGWYRSCGDYYKDFIRDYIGADDESEVNWKFIHTCFTSIADTAMVQMQEVLSLGSESRINIPSTCGTNWRWRIEEGDTTDKLAERLRKETAVSGRLH